MSVPKRKSAAPTHPTPAVGDYMSVIPQRIAPDQTLYEAHQVMRENRIRHLPVMDHGRLVGIVSMGDLHLLETLQDVDQKAVEVCDAMTAAPYTVTAVEPLATVARTMAENKYGSAIVVGGGDVVGVFTTNDALRALASLLEQKKPSPPRTARKAPARKKTAKR